MSSTEKKTWTKANYVYLQVLFDKYRLDLMKFSLQDWHNRYNGLITFCGNIREFS